MKTIRNILASIALMAAFAMPSAALAAGNRSAEIAAADGVTMTVASGHIELSVASEQPVRFHIYSITGQLVKSVTVSDGTTTIDLPKGIYIVKSDRWAKQVVVK